MTFLIFHVHAPPAAPVDDHASSGNTSCPVTSPTVRWTGGYLFCTRRPDHLGRHQAGTTARHGDHVHVVAEWDDDRTTDGLLIDASAVLGVRA